MGAAYQRNTLGAASLLQLMGCVPWMPGISPWLPSHTNICWSKNSYVVFFPPLLSGFRKARMFSEKGPFLENVGCIKVEGRARSKTLRGLETHCVQCSRFLECSSFDILTSFKSPSQPVVGLRFWCFSQLSRDGRGCWPHGPLLREHRFVLVILMGRQGRCV